MSHIIHRNTRAVPPLATHGNRAYLYDSSNRKYLDASSGAAVSCLGHNHPAPIKAIKKQAQELAYVHSGFFTSAISEQLADKITYMAPDPLNHVIFSSGGSEGMEKALKLARQYYYEIGENSRQYFISRRQSYHGNTLGALAIGQHTHRKKPFQPLLIPSNTVSPCYPYRHMFDNEDEVAYSNRLVNELKAKIEELGAENVIGFVAESVGGATAGVLPPVRNYLRGVRKLCDQYDILLILDEVMCGTGRTGSFLSCTQDNVVPDIAVVAKGLGGGYQPIAATLCSPQIYNALRSGSGAFLSSFTYMGHPIACAASLAVLETIEKENLIENVQRQGEYLVNQLRLKFDSHPNVGDIRGRGLFIGVEFVANRDTKETFDPSLSFHINLKRVCHQNGLLCYPGGGTADGLKGDHVLIAPPYIIDEEIADEIVDKLDRSIDLTLIESGIRT